MLRQDLTENTAATAAVPANGTTVRMRKVFWENPYLHTLKTTVAAVNGNEILFNATIGYAENGGQEDDKVTINGMPVVSLRKNDADHTIYYTLKDGHNLQIGDTVTMKIDWQRRYRLMRLHFAAELVLEIVNKLLNDIDKKADPENMFTDKKTGAHIYENKARIDFLCAFQISDIFTKILAEYNEIILSDKPIVKDYSDEASQRRFWKIDGYAEVPCGGTHVETTAEVGLVKLKREKISGKGPRKERIVITLFNDGKDEYLKQTADDIYNKSDVGPGFKTVQPKAPDNNSQASASASAAAPTRSM